MRPAPLRAALLLLALAPAAVRAAEPADSTYTRHAFASCPVIRASETGRVHRCRGPAGIPVAYDADEHSLLVGMGSSGEAASTDWLLRHNAEAGETIEWRSLRGGAPFAAILRLRATTTPSISAPRRAVLAVYRIDRVRSCILAVLDARAPDANADARRLADAHGPGFRCGRDEPMHLVR